MRRRHREPTWGLGRWYHDAIPVALGLIAITAAVWLFLSFLHAEW